MAYEKRITRRQPLRYSAWIAVPKGNPRNCVVSDVSETGARLAVSNNASVPDNFVLMLSRNGAARRYCSVVWRRDAEIGVKFARSLADAEKASLVAKADVGTRAAQAAVPAGAALIESKPVKSA